jgi:hypothetical protein
MAAFNKGAFKGRVAWWPCGGTCRSRRTDIAWWSLPYVPGLVAMELMYMSGLVVVGGASTRDGQRTWSSRMWIRVARLVPACAASVSGTYLPDHDIGGRP